MVGQREQADAGGPDPGSEDRDATWVPAEIADVLTDPTQGLDLVQESVVPFGRLVTCAEEPCHVATNRGISFEVIVLNSHSVTISLHEKVCAGF